MQCEGTRIELKLSNPKWGERCTKDATRVIRCVPGPYNIHLCDKHAAIELESVFAKDVTVS